MQPIYIVGAGGIGCAVGHALAAGGLRPTFVDANPGKISWGQSHGVGVEHRLPLAADFQLFHDWQPQTGAFVLLCTKCYDNASVLARLPANCILIPIQNGFDPLLDAQGHVLEGIASFVSECDPERTHTRITRAGCLHFGGWHALRYSEGRDDDSARPSEYLRACHPGFAFLVDALRQYGPFKFKMVPDILPFKYTKLMYNAAISPLAAAAGLDNGQLLSVPSARRLFFDLLRENYAILHGAAIPLARIGPFHPATVQRILRRRRLARLLAWAFYPTLRGTYCSMSGDLPRGRTEIDYYNRHLIDLAGDHPCPLNRRVYEMIKRMERNRLPPSLHVLEELAV